MNSKPIDADFFSGLISKDGLKNEVKGPSRMQKREQLRSELEKKRLEKQQQKAVEDAAEEQARGHLQAAKLAKKEKQNQRKQVLQPSSVGGQSQNISSSLNAARGGVSGINPNQQSLTLSGARNSSALTGAASKDPIPAGQAGTLIHIQAQETPYHD